MQNVTNFIITITAIITLLVLGKGILIPFVFAAIFWFVTREIRKNIYKIPFSERFIPVWLSNIIVFTLVVISVVFTLQIITTSIQSLTLSYKNYEPNIIKVIKNLGIYLHTDIVEIFEDIFEKFNYGLILKEIANSISGVLSNTFMIIIYALFLFLEESSLVQKVKKIFKDDESYKRYKLIATKIENSFSNYLKLKTYVSLLTGTLSYIVMIIVGVDGALFWAFLIFFLNYIPTIGSLFGTIFPALFSLVQFGRIQPFLIVLLTVGTIQVIVGNLIEPKVFGRSLNLSPLITIIGLAVWGAIWGITGMILSVPITVIMIIIFSKFKKTKVIAILLSENGDIDQ